MDRIDIYKYYKLQEELNTACSKYLRNYIGSPDSKTVVELENTCLQDGGLVRAYYTKTWFNSKGERQLESLKTDIKISELEKY